MKQRIVWLFIGLLLSGCSLFKQQAKTPAISISNEQLAVCLDRAVDELIKAQWLSDFLLKKNVRPILMNAGISNQSRASIDLNFAYEHLDLALIQSGEVRVVKTNDAQQSMLPQTLVKGQSVDLVLSLRFIDEEPIMPGKILVLLSLWSEDSTTPVFSSQQKIE